MLRLTLSYMFVTGLALGVIACAEHSGSTSTVCQNDALKQELFETHVVGTLGACVRCHGTTQAPLFATSDKEVAFAAAIPLLDGKPSRFEIRSGNGHCGSDCTNNAPVVAAMEAYRKAIGAVCTTDAKAYPHRSTSVSLANLPTNGNDQEYEVTFPNGTGAMATLALRLQIRRILFNGTDSGQCAIRRVQYRSPGGNFLVNGMQLWPDGTLDPELRNYIGILGKARTTTGNTTVTLYSLTQRLDCPEELSVAINADAVENIPPDGGNNVEAFNYYRDNIHPILVNPDRCFRCHNKTNGRLSFDNRADPPVVLGPGSANGGGTYQLATSKIFLLQPEESTLLRKPVDLPGLPSVPHPGLKVDQNGNPHLSTAEIESFLRWIRMERDAAYPPSP